MRSHRGSHDTLVLVLTKLDDYCDGIGFRELLHTLNRASGYWYLIVAEELCRSLKEQSEEILSQHPNNHNPDPKGYKDPNVHNPKDCTT